jgi:GNAT superfamily N-acetyltransferase
MREKLTIRWEPIDRLIFAGLEDLAVAHWEEAEDDKTAVPLALDFKRVRDFERAGQHKIAALRSGTRLVGYAAWTVITAMFHASTVHAFCTAIYVEPESRGLGSYMLLPWCEAHLPAFGVRKIYVAAKTERQRDLLAKSGYVLSETVHSKILGAPHGQQHRATAVHAA